MSVIVKLDNGRYRIEFKVKNNEGKWIKHNKTFNLRKECIAYENKVLQEIENHNKENSLPIINNLFEDYILYKQLKPSSMRNKISIFKNHIEPFFSSNTINYDNVYEWKNYVINLNCSTDWKNKMLFLMRDMIDVCLLKSNIDERESKKCLKVLSNLNDFNSMKKENNIFTYDDFNKYISTYKDNKYLFLYFNILYYCGLRISEMSGITWDNVKNNSLTINKQYCNGMFGTPKTQQSYRTIPLNNYLYNLLIEYKKSVKGIDNERIFITSQQNIRVQHKKHCKMANLEHIRIHDFRHSCCSMLFQAYKSKGLPVDFKTVAMYLGHGIKQTMDIYSHLYPDDIKDLSNLMTEFTTKKED